MLNNFVPTIVIKELEKKRKKDDFSMNDIFMKNFFNRIKLFDLGIRDSNEISNERKITSTRYVTFPRNVINPHFKLHKITLICRNVSKNRYYRRLIHPFEDVQFSRININKFRMEERKRKKREK